MTILPPQKYTPIIISSVLLIAIISLVWFGILPFRQTIEKKARNIQEFYAGREHRENQAGKLPELLGQYESIVAHEKTLNILTAENEVVDFVKTLEELANSMNVAMEITAKDNGKIVEAGPKQDANQSDNADQKQNSEKNKAAPKTPGLLDSVPFNRYLYLNVKAEGKYGDLVAFLGRLEALPFGLDVIKVDMKKKDAENNARPASALGTAKNPFAILGDSGAQLSKRQPAEKPKAYDPDALEAAFDVLVYVKN